MSASRSCCRLASAGLRSAGRRPTACPSLSNPTARFYASSSTGHGAAAAAGRFGVLLYGSAIAATAYVAYIYATDTRAYIHKGIVPPAIRLLFPDAEDAHHAGTSMVKTLYSLNLHPRERGDATKDTGLATEVFGTTIRNPIGISAGLDKDGEIPDALFALGAGVVEVGGCTPRPQDGNPKPRVFRVPSLDGMVNRYGLNSRGADDMAIRLRDRLRRYALSVGLTESQVLDGEANVPPGSLHPGRLLAVQIAKNKETTGEKAVIDDHVYCVRRLAPYADVIVVNVSSPNTPGLRDLQATEPLTRLLSAVVSEAAKTDRKQRPKVMVKVSPDEDEETQMDGIVQAVHVSGVDGVIVGNTTKRRQGLNPNEVRLTVKEQKALIEDGGYSGPAMFSRTLDLVSRYRKMLDTESKAKGDTQKTIFATGGITNGHQALQVLNAGASVAMVYTAMTYGGPGTVTRIKKQMIEEAGSK